MEEPDAQLQQVCSGGRWRGLRRCVDVYANRFPGALIDNNVRLLTLFDSKVANLVVMSRARYNVSTEQRFSRRLFEMAASTEGIVAATTASVERGTAKVKVEGREGNVSKPIRVIAIDVSNPDFIADNDVYQNLLEADRQDAALVDSLSKSFYGFSSSVEALKEQGIELNDKQVSIVGQFNLGTDFGNDGTILMSERIHADYFPWRNFRGDPRDKVDLGFLQAENSDPAYLQELAAKIEDLAPHEIMVKPTLVLEAEEKRFWSNQTPVGKIFFIGTLMGLLVGAIICYQIQFTDITEHMPEFATLKAMGYSPLYFWSLILWQSFYLACLGFFPGILVSWGLYKALYLYSGLIMEMSYYRIGLVWCLTLAMCAGSGAIALRKLFGADPASLF